jgi:hypothetical protein
MKIDNQETKEYLEKLEAVRLSASSRTRMERELLEYARFHKVEDGVRVGDMGRSIEQVPPSTSLIKRIFNSKLQPMTALLLMIALAIGGGTTYAAEGSVPGDFLYTMKVEVNEPIKSGVTLSNRAEAVLQARLAGERLKEAETLAAQGKLTAEIASDLSLRVKSHYDKAEARSVAAEAKGDYESSATTRASLEGTFRAYAEVLTQLNTNVSGNNGASLINDIRGYANVSLNAQATATAAVSTNLTATIGATVDQADRAVTLAKSDLEDVRAKISATAAAQVESRIEAAVSAQTNARAAFDGENYREAYQHAQKAINLATQAQTMISTTARVEGRIEFGTNLEGVLNSIIQTSGSTSSDEGSTNSDNGQDSNQSSGVLLDIDVNTDTRVDIDVLDVRLETDTSVGSGLRL